MEQKALNEAHIEQVAPKEVQVGQMAPQKAQIPKEILISYVYDMRKMISK